MRLHPWRFVGSVIKSPWNAGDVDLVFDCKICDLIIGDFELNKFGGFRIGNIDIWTLQTNIIPVDRFDRLSFESMESKDQEIAFRILAQHSRTKLDMDREDYLSECTYLIIRAMDSESEEEFRELMIKAGAKIIGALSEVRK